MTVSIFQRLRATHLVQYLLAARSIRWRLTGWYVLMLAGVLLVFSGGTYYAVRKVLRDNLDDSLRYQAGLIAQAVAIKNGEPTLPRDVNLAGSRSAEYFTRLYRQNGTLASADRRAADLPGLDSELTEALSGDAELTSLRWHDETLRVATFPIERDGVVAGAIQVGVSMEDIERTLRLLFQVMLFMAPAMLLVATGGGWFLATRALAPIDRITRTAQRISTEGLNERLNFPGPNDEVGRLAQTFDAMLARLEKAFERQRRFTSDASHELRTPLTAIIGQIDVTLERERPADSYRAALVNIRTQAQRLARLSSDLLFLARADTPRLTAAFEPIDLSDLLPAIVAQVEPLAQERQQDIALRLDSSLPIVGNEDQLIRLFLNLLDNAIRYSGTGGTITVESRNTATELSVRIRDNGPGIAAHHLPLLFERFYRADTGRNRAQGGGGLGLSIAQSIAQAHNGRITVESVEGQGSVFTVTLPSAASPTSGSRVSREAPKALPVKEASAHAGYRK